MKKQIPAIKGTKDILPPETRRWQHVEAVVKRICELYGYREIRTPIFEATELFEKGTGQTSDIVIKEMYTFTDKAGRSLTLRPEYTPSVVRSIIDNRLYLKSDPLRFYFMGPMFRYDKPQKGRYRQFHQLDVEVFAEEDPAVDAELVEMASYLLHELKVTDTETLVNSVGCKACRPFYITKLRAHAQKEKQELCEDCKRKVITNPLRIFDCKLETCQVIARDFPMITDHLCQECKEHFNKFCTHLDFYGLKYRIEPRLVRGIDYYTKTTFEIISSKLGAQDGLLSVVPKTELKEQFLYLAYLGDEAKKAGMALAHFLRREGVECLMEYKERGLKSQMSRANKLGATWVLIVGENEVKKGRYQLKNMATGRQEEWSQKEILDVIRETS